MKKIINQIQQQTTLSEQESWWLIEHITQKARLGLTYNNYQLSDKENKILQTALTEIATLHKPLAYIIGWVPFLDCTLDVKPPILIPRPETEAWVNDLIVAINQTQQTMLRILDIGTGSGCIAIALAKAFPQAQVYALDISTEALALAEHNSKKNNVKNIAFIQSDLFSNLPSDFRCDLIVSNPPYIPPTAHLEPSVKNWEDPQALFADNQGRAIITKIIDQAPQFLEKNSLLYNIIIEIDMTHGSIIKKMVDNNDQWILRQDQHGKDRTIWGAIQTLEK
jgi:release factor glutamine methyltransferase